MLVGYDTTAHTLFGGIKARPTERFEWTLDFAWNDSEASLAPFRFAVGESFAAGRPNQSYDFSSTDQASDLATTLLEASIGARWFVREDLFLTGSYRLLDFQDDAPYLGDDSGTIDYAMVGVGWTF